MRLRPSTSHISILLLFLVIARGATAQHWSLQDTTVVTDIAIVDVRTGKLADLVFLDANPLEDIRNTQKVTAVILNGRHLSKGDLQKLLQRVEESAKKPPSTRTSGTF